MRVSWNFWKMMNIGQYIFSENPIKKKSVPIERLLSRIKYIPAESVIAWPREDINHPNPLNIIQNFLISYCISRARLKRWVMMSVSFFSLENIRITLRLENVSTIRLKRLSQYIKVEKYFFLHNNTRISHSFHTEEIISLWNVLPKIWSLNSHSLVFGAWCDRLSRERIQKGFWLGLF